MASRSLVLGVALLVSSCGEVPQRESSASPGKKPSITAAVAETSPTATTVVANLEPTSSLTVVAPRVDACVDARSQLAPTLIPDGWNRFVLQAQPTGSCAALPFLMMSLVLPADADGPGTLVMIVTRSAGEATPQPGDAVEINGNAGTMTLNSTEMGPNTSLDIVIDTVAVNIHGNADEAQVRSIAESIRPLDDTEWAALVNAIQTPP